MKASVIPLKCWKNPQGDIILISSEYECSVFFGCWDASGAPADYICRLSFSGAVVSRSYTREHIPYSVLPHTYHSHILLIPDSDMKREHLAYRQQHYPQAKFNPGELSHFVVQGHDVYHEVLAQSFTETVIDVLDINEDRLRALHRNT
jgi:hypothetical protein